VTVTLDAASSEVSRARHLVLDTLRGVTSDERAYDAALLTSELVTNSLVHARPPVRLTIDVQRADVVVTVSDSGGAPGTGPRLDHGRGLALVRDVASRCGASASADGTTVWFSLPLDQPPASLPQSGVPTVGSAGSSASHGATAGPISMPSGHDSR
jgi:two-component sensor histidine kinase